MRATRTRSLDYLHKLLDDVVAWFARHGLPAEAGRASTARFRVDPKAVVFTGDWDAVDEAVARLH